MAPNANASESHARLLRRLAVVADEGRPEFIRLAAIRSVQAMLPDANPLARESSDQLLDRVLRPWDVRAYLVAGRGVMRTVSRPPISMRDVWA